MADGCGEQYSVWAQHTSGLAQAAQALGMIREVIERPKHQDSIRGGVALFQVTGIADAQAGDCVLVGIASRLLDMFGNGIYEMDVVAA